MIILPAISAIIGLLGTILEPILVSIGIGAAFGAGVGGIGSAVSGVQEHGEFNHEVAEITVHAAAEGALDGALWDGVFGVVGVAAGPIVGAVGVAAKPAVQVFDDLAGPAIKAIGGAIDDVARPALGKAGSAASSTVRSVGRAASAPYRIGRAAWHARFYKSMPKPVCSGGCAYLMDDALTGTNKIGYTFRHPTRRLAEVSRDVGRPVTYRGIMPVDDAFAAETALHRQFASQRAFNMPGREWFNLSLLDKAYVFGS